LWQLRHFKCSINWQYSRPWQILSLHVWTLDTRCISYIYILNTRTYSVRENVPFCLIAQNTFQDRSALITGLLNWHLTDHPYFILLGVNFVGKAVYKSVKMLLFGLLLNFLVNFFYSLDLFGSWAIWKLWKEYYPLDCMIEIKEQL
jgi:hypothetical protein